MEKKPPAQRTQSDRDRGIRNVSALYKDKTVAGNFDKVSIGGRIAKNIAMGNSSLAAERAVVAFGDSYITKQAERLRENRKKAAEKRGETNVNLTYNKKMVGPMFWLMVALAVTKDVLDVIFAASVVLSFLSSIFAVLVSLTVLFYMKYNNVPFTTRKVVTMAITFIIEFIPFASLLPLTTINLFIVRIIDNNERLTKLVEKSGGAINILTPSAHTAD